MNPVASIARRFAVMARPASLFQLVICPLLVLGLTAAAARPEPAAHPQPVPPATVFIVTTFSFAFEGGTEAYQCVGFNDSIEVTVTADISGLPNQGDQYHNLVVPGITIESSVDNAGVLSVTPARLSAGHLPVDLTDSPGFFSGNANGLGAVTFHLHAKKAGTATVHLKATIPSQLTGAAPQVIAIDQSYEVDNCKYRFAVRGYWSQQYPNLVSRLTETLLGQLDADDAEHKHLSGTGDVTWSLRSYSALCGHSHSITLGQAHITAVQGEDAIGTTVNYDPFELSTVNCGSATHGPIQPPSFITSLPVTGGTFGVYEPFKVGNEGLQGSRYTNIIPLPIH